MLLLIGPVLSQIPFEPWCFHVYILGYQIYMYSVFINHLASPSSGEAELRQNYDGAQGLHASNERPASTMLKSLSSAGADFRANDLDGNHVKDFWTGTCGIMSVQSEWGRKAPHWPCFRGGGRVSSPASLPPTASL
jgi:hypothetical protein